MGEIPPPKSAVDAFKLPRPKAEALSNIGDANSLRYRGAIT